MTRKIKHSISGLAVVAVAILFGACATPTAKLTVSRNDITAGEAVTVKWETKDAKEILLNGEKVEKIGAKSVTPPTGSNKYEIVAKRGKKMARDSATVAVTAVKAPEPKVSLTADKSALDLGQSTTLRWSTENAKIVTITGLGEVPGSGEREISPRSSTTYTATALGDGGSATASARVTVTEPPPPAPPVVEVKKEPPAAERFRSVARSIFFDYDKSDLLEPEQEKLRVLATFLNIESNRSIIFRVEGNCDPRGTAEYNIGLGDRRARSIRDFLGSLGVDPSRIETVSYGSEKAQGTQEGSNLSPPSWAYDRRGDFVYLRGGDLP
ncbi:MAG: OmpA family protein [Chloracidobacterium sp.]|nr:OmpA family protein [Chloracidobacterium sp.]